MQHIKGSAKRCFFKKKQKTENKIHVCRDKYENRIKKHEKLKSIAY